MPIYWDITPSAASNDECTQVCHSPGSVLQSHNAQASSIATPKDACVIDESLCNVLISSLF